MSRQPFPSFHALDTASADVAQWGVALVGVRAWFASDLGVTRSRYASGPYTPVDPILECTNRLCYSVCGVPAWQRYFCPVSIGQWLSLPVW